MNMRRATYMLVSALAGCQPSGDQATDVRQTPTSPIRAAPVSDPPKHNQSVKPPLTFTLDLIPRQVEPGVFDTSDLLSGKICTEAALLAALRDERPCWRDAAAANTVSVRFLKPGTYVVHSVHLTRDGKTDQRQLRIRIEPSDPPGQTREIRGIAFEKEATREFKLHDKIMLLWPGIGGRCPSWTEMYDWRLEGISYSGP